MKVLILDQLPPPTYHFIIVTYSSHIPTHAHSIRPGISTGFYSPFAPCYYSHFLHFSYDVVIEFLIINCLNASHFFLNEPSVYHVSDSLTMVSLDLDLRSVNSKHSFK